MEIQSLQSSEAIHEKSLTELRTIAQGLGVAGLLSKNRPQLISAIEARNKVAYQVKPKAPEVIIEDSRLRDAPPAEECTEDMILEVLLPYINRGLIVEFDNKGSWTMQWGDKNDSGTMAQPLRNVVRYAKRLMK